MTEGDPPVSGQQQRSTAAAGSDYFKYAAGAKSHLHHLGLKTFTAFKGHDPTGSAFGYFAELLHF